MTDPADPLTSSDHLLMALDQALVEALPPLVADLRRMIDAGDLDEADLVALAAAYDAALHDED